MSETRRPVASDVLTRPVADAICASRAWAAHARRELCVPARWTCPNATVAGPLGVQG